VKKSRHGVVSLEEIFYWCMAVDGYKVKEDNVDCVHDDDVQLIWKFVDTTRTSSTLQCGDMLSTIAGNRSGDGFRRSCVIKRVTNDKPRQAGFSVTELQSLGWKYRYTNQSPNHTIIHGYRRSLALKPLKDANGTSRGRSNWESLEKQGHHLTCHFLPRWGADKCRTRGELVRAPRPRWC
jgi:hypothetical protein